MCILAPVPTSIYMSFRLLATALQFTPSQMISSDLSHTGEVQPKPHCTNSEFNFCFSFKISVALLYTLSRAAKHSWYEFLSCDCSVSSFPLWLTSNVPLKKCGSIRNTLACNDIRELPLQSWHFHSMEEQAVLVTGTIQGPKIKDKQLFREPWLKRCKTCFSKKCIWEEKTQSMGDGKDKLEC